MRHYFLFKAVFSLNNWRPLGFFYFLVNNDECGLITSISRFFFYFINANEALLNSLEK